ncbi:MAG: Usg family protein [Alphaproteobacteria bacterium]|nr:Usg family protein [Alphaproteobacteria bacterium]
MRDIERQLQGYRLTTAEITYRLPDFPELLQIFVWQKLALAPRFPELKRFLAYWESNLDGRIHSVRVAGAGIIAPAALRHARAEYRLH